MENCVSVVDIAAGARSKGVRGVTSLPRDGPQMHIAPPGPGRGGGGGAAGGSGLWPGRARSPGLWPAGVMILQRKGEKAWAGGLGAAAREA